MGSLAHAFGTIGSFAYTHALPLSLAGLVVAVAVCTKERDSRIRAEGQREVYTERFTASVQRADSLEQIRIEADSAALRAATRISRLRARADSLQRVAERAARRASSRATRAGDSLTATLDSLARVVPPTLEPLTRTAIRQHTEEQDAHQTVVTALQQQLASTQELVAHADSTVRIWQTRYRASEDAREAAVRALEDAEGVVGVRGQASGRDWSRDLQAAGAGALLYLVVDRVVIPMVGRE